MHNKTKFGHTIDIAYHLPADSVAPLASMSWSDNFAENSNQVDQY
jgi:hypothetical protein